jgi:hypothetical protein
VAGCCKHGNGNGSINDREFFDKLNDYQFLKKDFASVSY